MSPNQIGRIGLAGAPAHKRNEIVKPCNLAAGDLYVAPTASETVDATQPYTFKWNTACTMDSSIDIYLYEPASDNGVIKGWTDVQFSSGQMTLDLLPKWWNSTTTATLYLSIVNTGSSMWDTSGPSGPVFTVSYPASAMFSTTTKDGQAITSTAAAAATQSTDAVFQNVSSTGHKGLAKGAIAAAVIVPLLVLCVVAGVAVRFWRAREAEKRRRWSQALSTHSNLEWEKGAQPGEKPHSILGRPSTQLGRPSTHHSARPASFATASVYGENNMAGAGAGGAFRPTHTNLRSVSSENVASRSSFVLPDGQVRQSRISFAEAARPDRRSRLSLGGDLRPDVPTKPAIFSLKGASRSATELNTPSKKHAAYATGSAIADDDEDINISPSQLQGPNAFAEAEAKRIGAARRTGRRSILSFGGGDKRRESTASALSADDFKSAASARGSVDELRDLEAVMLMRRSVMSQHSANKAAAGDSPALEAVEADQIESLEPNVTLPTSAPMPSMPTPIAGSSTVAYGPDQMLAVYAARAKSGNPAALSPTMTGPAAAAIPVPKPTATRQNSAMRVLTNLGKKDKEDKEIPSAPAPGDMKSYVHLNKGTASSAAVEALPLPGGRNGSGSGSSLTPDAPARAVSMASEGSRYSEVEEGQGNAK
ncbi:hypothetical protein BCR39DRAFT_465186 [Naematelia encephala]|uniref:Uncharacterized protein n=1 Tax=Naematelia encephala TaxID=71784 RepID=A0A1Y2BAX6_9TREE|nr:hypothetical protein BCR39DRAFT_465186 [Naematelia encephala]